MRPYITPPDPSSLTNRTLFVIGDVHLHLGSPAPIVEDLRRILEAIGRREPRSCIVFNGDLFDLDRIGGERAGGVGEQQVAERIGRVFDKFSGLTAVLGAHLANGGVLVFVAGNHDAEILLPCAQQVLADRLGAGGLHGGLYTVERLSLPHLLIEHGHQSDPDCAFYPDTCTAIRKGRLSAFPLACLLTRFFLSRNPRFEDLGDHYRAPLAVLIRIVQDYKLDSVAMILGYPIASLRILWQSILARARGDAPAGSHLTLTMSSPWVVARRLYLDRYLGFLAAAGLLLGVSLGLLAHVWWWVLGPISLYLIVPPFRRKAFRERDVRQCATTAACHIRNGAQIVILGHTHRAFVSHLDGGTYANHGSFALPALVDDKGKGSSVGRSAPRHYLTVTMEPAACELCMLPPADCQAGDESAAHSRSDQ